MLLIGNFLARKLFVRGDVFLRWNQESKIGKWQAKNWESAIVDMHNQGVHNI